MSNFDSSGRNIGDATATPHGAQFIGMNVAQGDEVGRAEAIKKIREATGNNGKSVSPEPQEPSQDALSSQSTADGELDPEDVLEPEVDTDAVAPVSKRSLKLSDLDELVIDFDGEELSLSADDLKKGAGLYKANNKKAEELARERKALEAQKADLAAKANQEVSSFDSDIATREGRNRQIDEWLEYAYANNYETLFLQDGSKVGVGALERERKANELAIRRIQDKAESKRIEIEQYANDWRESQQAILEQHDPTILTRLDDIASYLEREGFTENQAQSLINADAKLVIALDKARKFTNALNSKPEKKKAVQTKVISKSSGRGNFMAQPAGVNNSKWEQVVNDPKMRGTSQYRDALKQIRISQMANR